eukprot:11432928-Alexandrium_andersonii.AAC.1
MLDNRCNALKAFANWVGKRGGLQAAILAEVGGEHANSRRALAGIKQSWRECDALVARAVKRSAEGLA